MPAPADPDIAQQVYDLIRVLGIGPAAAALDAPPAQLRAAVDGQGPVYNPVRRWDEPAARAAFQLAYQVGSANQAAQMLGTQGHRLRAAWDRWGLGRPTLTTTAQAAPITPEAASRAMTVARAQGVKAAAAALGCTVPRLYRVWDRYQLGRPSDTPREAWPSRVYTDRAAAQQAMTLAREHGNRAAMRAHGVGETTLYRAWDRWGLGRPTDDPEAAARAQARATAVMGRLIAGGWAQARALHARRHTPGTRATVPPGAGRRHPPAGVGASDGGWSR